jgi:hypothetical protein
MPVRIQVLNQVLHMFGNLKFVLNFIHRRASLFCSIFLAIVRGVIP